MEQWGGAVVWWFKKRRKRMKAVSIVDNAVLMGVFFASCLMFGCNVSAAEQKSPCGDDIAKFCKDVQPGQQTLLQCLEEHESQLSDACKEYEVKIERPRAESREVMRQQMMVRQTCRNDVTRFCNDVKLGSAGINTCLGEHSTELSIPCRDALQKARGGKEENTAK
jgi:hypothetical protein